MPRALPKPLNDPAEILKMVDRINKSDDNLGDLCIWAAERIEISPKKLQELLKTRGIDEWAPVSIRKKTAARKALSVIRPQLESGDLKVLVRKVMEDENYVRYAIVDEQKDLVRTDLDFSTRNQVLFNKEAGLITFTGDEIPQIVELYEYLCDVYTSREILLMTRNIILGHGAIPMRDGSGMYFLPSSMSHITKALKGLYNEDLHQTYGKSFFRAFGIAASKTNKAEIVKTATADVMEGLQEAEKELREALTNDNVRPSTLERMVERYKMVTAKADMYKQLLNLKMEEIDDKVSETESLVRKVLL